MINKKIKIEKFQFPQELKHLENEYIFHIKLEKVIEERCDELDYILEEEGYTILHQDYIRVATSIYNYLVYFI